MVLLNMVKGIVEDLKVVGMIIWLDWILYVYYV